MKKWAQSAYYVEEIREQASWWLKKNNIDPIDVPISGFVREGENGYVEVEVFERDENHTIKYDFDLEAPITKWVVVQSNMPDNHLLEELT